MDSNTATEHIKARPMAPLSRAFYALAARALAAISHVLPKPRQATAFTLDDE